MSTAFDTLRLARTLRDKAHFSAEQAEGMADAMAEVLQSDIATTSDVRAVRDELKGDVRAVRDELKGDVRAVRDELKGDVRAVRDELKGDLRAVRDELKADLRQTELRLEAKIEASKSDLLKWVVGMIGFQTIVLLGAALALARVLTR